MDNSPDDPRLERAFALIRQVVADAENRVRQELIDLMQKMVAKESALPIGSQRNPLAHQDQAGRGEQEEPTAPNERLIIKRKRARQGLVREVVMRELTEAPAGGFTPSEIAARVRNDEERAISPSSFRSELRAGGEANIYRSVEGGKWILVRVEEEQEKAGPAVESNPAFSLGESEGR